MPASARSARRIKLHRETVQRPSAEIHARAGDRRVLENAFSLVWCLAQRDAVRWIGVALFLVAIFLGPPFLFRRGLGSADLIVASASSRNHCERRLDAATLFSRKPPVGRKRRTLWASRSSPADLLGRCWLQVLLATNSRALGGHHAAINDYGLTRQEPYALAGRAAQPCQRFRPGWPNAL